MLNTPQQFMMTSERVIVQQFLKLRGAVLIHTPHGNAVYVPATRSDAVLLVAHTDTVWFDANIQLHQFGDIVTSAVKGIGIGADDRAGIAALWELRSAGHAMLLVPEEESGCKGSTWIADNAAHILARHNFMIQFDRRGGLDLVTYDCDNPAFNNYLLNQLRPEDRGTYVEDRSFGYDTGAAGGFKMASGSFSDIAVLAPVAGIAAVNISIGFRNEHTERESLNLAEWRNTVESVRVLLAAECPHFEYIESKYAVNWGFSAYDTTTIQDDIEWDDDVCPQCDRLLVDDLTYSYCPDCMQHYDYDDFV